MYALRSNLVLGINEGKEMTVPHLMNCSHSADGWCLDCVVELGNENWRLRDVARDAADAATQHQAEVLRLRAALANNRIAPARGWRFERDDMNRIIVVGPDGSGCVVDNVANNARMIPEEVLFALAVALGA